MKARDVGPADYFISHCWSRTYSLHDINLMIFSKTYDASAFVWIDIFAVNQHGGAAQASDLDNLKEVSGTAKCVCAREEAGRSPLHANFRALFFACLTKVVRASTRGTLVLLDGKGIVLTRIWSVSRA